MYSRSRSFILTISSCAIDRDDDGSPAYSCDGDVDFGAGSASKLDSQKHTGRGNTKKNECHNEKVKSVMGVGGRCVWVFMFS